MNGKHRVIVSNKRTRFEFELKRNITIIKGESATGKTTLIDMVSEYVNNGESSSITLLCDKKCFVVDGATWQGQLSVISDSIVFIDEGNPFVCSKDFAEAIRGTDNYYVIVTREALANLPYSVEEIYGIHNAGRYGSLKQFYNEFYRIYGNSDRRTADYDTVITEDSNSGFEFFSSMFSDKQILAAAGKSNILEKLKDNKGDRILVFADGAAFGCEMEKLMMYVETGTGVTVFLPESFEWLILRSGVVDGNEVQNILEAPEDSIDYKKFFSWEQFFTHVLMEYTEDTYLQYSKSSLNENYLKGVVYQKIKDTIYEFFGN